MSKPITCLKMRILHVTYCSGKKNPIDEGTPEQIYDSQRITSFIEVCKSKAYNWAILSAKYGLFFPYEVNKNYNVTFKSVAYECRVVKDGIVLSQSESRKHISSLEQQVRKRILENAIEKVVFYCRPPIKWRKCYLYVLHAGVDRCEVNHKKWIDLVEHITKMYSNGIGKVHIITQLRHL